MASATVWKPAYDAKLTYDSVAQKCMSVEHGWTGDEFETTNNEGDGSYEFGIGGEKHQLRWSTPVAADSVLPAEKSLLDAVFNDGLFTFTGKARVTSASRKGGGKGGYTIDYQATFTGTVTKAAVV